MKQRRAWRWTRNPRTYFRSRIRTLTTNTWTWKIISRPRRRFWQSETLAFQTIKSLDLGRYPEFGGGPGASAFGQGAARSKRPAILGAFLGGLSVKRVPNSRLIEVRFEAEDPQLAAQIVNAHLQNYIEQNFRSKYDATTQASNWLSAELEELRIKVEKSEDARLAYERQNQIWQIDEKQDITTQKLADLSKAVTEAQTGLAEKEALYRMAQSGNVDALPAARDNAGDPGPAQAEIRDWTQRTRMR